MKFKLQQKLAIEEAAYSSFRRTYTERSRLESFTSTTHKHCKKQMQTTHSQGTGDYALKTFAYTVEFMKSSNYLGQKNWS